MKANIAFVVSFLALIVVPVLLLAVGAGLAGLLLSDNVEFDTGYRSELVFLGNTEKGGYYHMRYLELAHAGYPVVFRSDARDRCGNPIEDYLAVYTQAGALEETHAALDRLEARDRFSDVRWTADSGQPYHVWKELSDIRGGLESVEGRRLLARAFERSAERSERMAEQYHSSSQSLLGEAAFDREIARRLRAGEPIKAVMAAAFAYYPGWPR